jgi:hypothetical protein
MVIAFACFVSCPPVAATCLPVQSVCFGNFTASNCVILLFGFLKPALFSTLRTYLRYWVKNPDHNVWYMARQNNTGCRGRAIRTLMSMLKGTRLTCPLKWCRMTGLNLNEEVQCRTLALWAQIGVVGTVFPVQEIWPPMFSHSPSIFECPVDGRTWLWISCDALV